MELPLLVPSVHTISSLSLAFIEKGLFEKSDVAVLLLFKLTFAFDTTFPFIYNDTVMVVLLYALIVI